MLIRFLLLFSFVFLFLISAGAQHFCKTDEYAAKDPNSAQIQAEFNQKLNETLRSSPSPQKLIYTVPVVFHIVHDNGPENIPDSLIYNALEEANLRLLNAAPYYHELGHTTNVQLCLASVDPYGNPTTGITRTQSAETVMDFNDTDLPMKNVIRWDPQLYLNIWIVRQSASLSSAYATTPSSAGNASDGIVFSYLGVYGKTLNHEVGHYLGLYHTFSWNCDNNDCSLDGDCVCDTPPDLTSDGTCMGNSCSSDADDTSSQNPFTTDVDELPNYMDYSTCDLSFTQGQVDRIHGVLNSVRSTLLQSNGCGQHPDGVIPTASFVYNFSCYNTTFTNTSANSVGAQWDFNSDGIIDDCGNTVLHQFTTNGIYTVTMYATGYGGIDTIVQQINGQTPPSPYYPLQWGYQGIYTYNFGPMMFCEDSTVSVSGVPGMQSYLWSNGDTTQTTTFQPTEGFVLSLTAVDMNGLSWTPCVPLTVEKAPVPLLTIEETPSNWCIGDSVTVNAAFSSSMSANAWYENNMEITGFHDTSYTTILGDTNTFYVYQQHVTGCESWSDTLTIIAQDCESLGIKDNSMYELSVFPNPAEDKITLSWSSPADKISVFIYQADGKLVYEREIAENTSQQTSVNVSQWTPGIYFLKLNNPESYSSGIRFMVK